MMLNIKKLLGMGDFPTFRGTPVTVYSKDSDYRVTDNFHLREFGCQCSHPQCTITLINEEAVWQLQELRSLWGFPIYVTSAYRCPRHNEEVGGKINSRHIRGLGFDITVKDLTNLGALEMYARLCFDTVIPYEKHLHVHIIEQEN